MADSNTDHTKPVHVVGPYAVYGRLAAGGMATVHLGRVIDPNTECRTVAIKRLHPQFSKDPEFVAMFIDEAKLAARVKHPNVVDTLTTLTMGQELLLVMEYIRGECFSKLLRAARRKNLHPSVPVVGTIIAGMLRGLHAAHEVKDDQGNSLNVVHRDISPQNVMIGADGIAKVLDFGVAKASARIQITRDGQMKGKLSYMSPEQLQGQPVDRRADVFACGVVLWEALTRKRLFVAEEAGEVMAKILREDVPPPSTYAAELTPEVDAVVLRALHKDNTKRYQTAEQLALDLERVIDVATSQVVGEWIESVAGEILGKRARLLAEIESAPIDQSLAAAAEASFADSTEFEQLQSWAEREAARVIAREEEKGVAAKLKAADVTRSDSSQARAESASDAEGSIGSGGATSERGVKDTGKSSLENDARDSEPPTTVSLPPGLPESSAYENAASAEDNDDQTAVTLTVDPELAMALRAERETIAPVQPRPPPLPEHLKTSSQPVRRTRWGVILSLAATVLALGVAVFVQVQDDSLPLSSFFRDTAQERALSLRPRSERPQTVAETRRAADRAKSTGSRHIDKEAQPVSDSPRVGQDGLSVSDLNVVSEGAAKGPGVNRGKVASAEGNEPQSDKPQSDKPQSDKPQSNKPQSKASRAVVVKRPRVPVVRRRKVSIPKVVTARKKRRVQSAPANDCDVPYWVDARGIRRLKVACL